MDAKLEELMTPEVKAYLAELARRTNAKLKGTEAGRARAAKMRAARKGTKGKATGAAVCQKMRDAKAAKREERLAAVESTAASL